MEELIEKFCIPEYYHGYGDSDGFGDGGGYGSGYSDGSGECYDEGSGYGDGYGDGSGSGSGYGDGYGDNYGCGYGYGSSYGYGDGIKQVNGNRIYYIDDIPTVITSVRDNVAVGAIFNKDFTFTPCYIVKEDGKFAHGHTLHEAFLSLQEKLYDDSTEEERLEAFKRKFPEYDTSYSNADFYDYHHVLTGSCRLGRDNFREQHGLTMKGTMTVREFVELTKNEYGGDIVQRLPKIYGK